MSTMAEQVGTGPSHTSKDLVVFSILRDSKCAECGGELWHGSLLFMESGRALCLRCADLDHLVYLGRGDTALTRRARKYSTLSAVVVRFSRSRGRYERQGLLVEEAALERAERECLADADQLAARREREEARRTEQDRDLAARMADAILELFPGCHPPRRVPLPRTPRYGVAVGWDAPAPAERLSKTRSLQPSLRPFAIAIPATTSC